MNITWLFEDHDMPQISGLTIINAGKRTLLLNIDSVTATHAGTYKCIARNNAGMVEYSTELRVNGLSKMIGLSYFLCMLYIEIYNRCPMSITIFQQ